MARSQTGSLGGTNHGLRIKYSTPAMDYRTQTRTEAHPKIRPYARSVRKTGLGSDVGRRNRHVGPASRRTSRAGLHRGSAVRWPEARCGDACGSGDVVRGLDGRNVAARFARDASRKDLRPRPDDKPDGSSHQGRRRRPGVIADVRQLPEPLGVKRFRQRLGRTPLWRKAVTCQSWVKVYLEIRLSHAFEEPAVTAHDCRIARCRTRHSKGPCVVARLIRAGKPAQVARW